jgi:DNA-binding transcriptional MerR regulator
LKGLEMPGDRKPKGNLIPIKTLAEMAGVSIQTVHYYLREGLLTPPTKTARNMAYYDPRCVEEIKQIRELQARRFLPLSVIKMIIGARRQGQDINHIGEMQSFMEGIFQPVEGRSGKQHLSSHEMAEASGLSTVELEELEKKGFLTPIKQDSGLTYDDIDLQVAGLWKKLIGFGLKPGDLEIYRKYITLAQEEFKTMHEAMHRLPDHESVPLTELLKAVEALKGALALRIFRQEAEKQHYLSFPQGEQQ